jgi:chromosome segregation ATPase
MKHDERSDPEKVRLVAEVNAVWRRLEEEEEKRRVLGEEIEELHLAFMEEQQARSEAAQREASALHELHAVRDERAALQRGLDAALERLRARRKRVIARSAAAGGLFGIAIVLHQALRGRVPRVRLWA